MSILQAEYLVKLTKSTKGCVFNSIFIWKETYEWKKDENEIKLVICLEYDDASKSFVLEQFSKTNDWYLILIYFPVTELIDFARNWSYRHIPGQKW